MSDKIRIDKWLWAVRIFKTRSLAADACEKKKILINGVGAKASRIIKLNDVVSVKNGAFTLTFKVLQLTEKRMAGKNAHEHCEDLTPAEEVEKMKMHALALRMSRNPGTGRPTKNERRALDEFLDWDYL
ncbi:MAG TPA: RNA-binding S4 domain-containing protein [Bacteroidia bacterium]|nr:RNA-binding S4 domain-containing protein [Bacteroidia bacterium]HNU34230.1 RNA-binding S4 domain-containing protein [Bacteroidia bacterium]